MAGLKNLRKNTLALVAQINEAELAVRMAEAVLGINRPAGLTAEECLHGDAAYWLIAARTAMLYWRECIQKAQQS